MKLRVAFLLSYDAQSAHKFGFRPSAVHHLPCLHSLFVANAFSTKRLVDVVEHAVEVLLHVGTKAIKMLLLLLT